MKSDKLFSDYRIQNAQEESKTENGKQIAVEQTHVFASKWNCLFVSYLKSLSHSFRYKISICWNVGPIQSQKTTEKSQIPVFNVHISMRQLVDTEKLMKPWSECEVIVFTSIMSMTMSAFISNNIWVARMSWRADHQTNMWIVNTG